MPKSQALPDDLWHELRDRKRQVEDAEARVPIARTDLDTAIAVAIEHGHQVAAIAEATQLSRESVYAAHRRHQELREGFG